VPGPFDGSSPNGYRLLPDPLSPGGIRAEPAGPVPFPNTIKYGIPQ